MVRLHIDYLLGVIVDYHQFLIGVSGTSFAQTRYYSISGSCYQTIIDGTMVCDDMRDLTERINVGIPRRTVRYVPYVTLSTVHRRLKPIVYGVRCEFCERKVFPFAGVRSILSC